jgi:hypothetical protein
LGVCTTARQQKQVTDGIDFALYQAMHLITQNHQIITFTTALTL